MDNTQEYATINHTWQDIWSGKDISVGYRFRRPDATVLKRLQSTAQKNSSLAARQLCLDVIHDEDKEKFVSETERYPGIVTTISGALLKASGMADLGN